MSDRTRQEGGVLAIALQTREVKAAYDALDPEFRLLELKLAARTGKFDKLQYGKPPTRGRGSAL